MSFSGVIALTNNYFYLTWHITIGSVTINNAGRWDGTIAPFEKIGDANFTTTGSGKAIIPVSDTNIFLSGDFSNYIS